MLFEYDFIDYICISYGDMKRFSLPKRPVTSEYFEFLLGFLSSRKVLGEICDYGQYIIHPETLCRTEWYTDTILALTAYIRGHSEQMPFPSNIACGTLPSITLISIENSPVYIPSYIAYEDTYCTPIQGGSFRKIPSIRNQLEFMSPNEHFSTRVMHICTFLLKHRV